MNKGLTGLEQYESEKLMKEISFLGELNQHIKRISEGKFDTENFKFSFAITEINDIL